MNQRNFPFAATGRFLLAINFVFYFFTFNIVLAQSSKEPIEEGSEAVTLDDIVVVGERTERSLLETTTSVTVITEEDLQRNDANRVFDALRHTPNVTPTPPDFLPSVRGVQSGGPVGLGGSLLAATQPRAKLIVDDVARLQTLTNNSYQSTFDIEQVELLRGPQTTSRGSNAISGAYIVKTKDPVFYTEGAAEAGIDWNKISDFGYRANFMYNTPIIEDELASRFVLQYENDRIPTEVYDDGSAPSGTDFDALSEYYTTSFRSKFLYQPKATPKFTALFTVENEIGRDISFDSWVWGRDASDFAVDGKGVTPEDRKYGYSGGQRIFKTNDYSFTADLRYAVGKSGEIQSITSFMKNKFEDAPDANADSSGVTFEELNRDLFSQDLLYNFKEAGPLEGVLGLSFSRETGDTRTGLFAINSEDEKESQSVFADLTYHVSDDFRVLGGGRYMVSKVIFDGKMSFGIPDFPPAIIDVDQTETIFLPKLGLAYDLDDQQTIFVTSRRGFNPGGGGTDFGSFTFYEFDPEFVWTHEVGYRNNQKKSSWSVVGFYNQYEDYQFSYSPDPNTSRILNFDGNTYGLEVEARAEVSKTVQLTGGIGLLRTEIDAPGEEIDGNRFGEDPEVTLNTGVVWQATSNLSADLAATYVGEYYYDFTETKDTESGDYTNVDIGTTYEVDEFKIRGFVRNVFDQFQYFQKTTPGGSGYVLPPREIGATATYFF